MAYQWAEATALATQLPGVNRRADQLGSPIVIGLYPDNSRVTKTRRLRVAWALSHPGL